MKEQGATISSLFYAVAGVIAMMHDPYLGFAFGVGYCSVGIGSALYHSDVVPWGQSLDEVTMYASFSILISTQVYVMFGVWLALPVLLVPVVLGIYHKQKWVDSFVWMPILVIATLVLLGLHVNWIIAGILALSYGLAVYIRDFGERALNDGDLVAHGWLHGIWHFMTAANALATIMLSLRG